MMRKFHQFIIENIFIITINMIILILILMMDVEMKSTLLKRGNSI